VYVVVRVVNTYAHYLKDEGVKNIIKYFIIVNIEWEVMRVKVNLLGVVGYVGSIVSKFSRINIIKPRRNYSTPLKFTTKAKEDVKKSINDSKMVKESEKGGLKEEAKQEFSHPTIVERGEENGEGVTLYVSHVTGSPKSIKIGEKIIETTRLENGRHPKGGDVYLVGVIGKVEVNKKDLESGKILEEDELLRKSNTKEEIVKIVNECSEIMKEKRGQEIVYDMQSGRYSKEFKMEGYEE